MPKTIVFANGQPTADLSEIKDLVAPDDTIICADGGTQYALAAGLMPQLIVGDLDSLSPAVQAEMRAEGVEIQVHPVKKDQTDLELALTVAVERGAKEILLLTALGGRLDQLLANILLLTRPEWAGVRLSLAEGRQRAWLLRGPDELVLAGRPNDTLSLLPLTATVTGLDLEQVAWPLADETITFGTTLTISNSFLGSQARVSLQTGLMLVVHIRA